MRKSLLMSVITRFALGVLVCYIASIPNRAYGQAGSSGVEDALTSEQRPVRLIFQPVYQYISDGDLGVTLTESSAQLQAIVPFGERWQLSVAGSGASASGSAEATDAERERDIQNLSGFSDIRSSLSYVQPVGDGSVIFTLNASAPTGKQELTSDEFITARFLSQSFYQFRVPSFGQGATGGGSATWAVPVGEDLVLGIGGSYQYRGSYSPEVGGEAEYTPGNEIRVTGGADFRLTQTSAFSANASLFVYGTDTVDGVEQFEVGNQIKVALQYIHQTGFQTIRVLTRYRSQEKSTLPVVNGQSEQLQILPSRATLQSRYSTRLADQVRLGLFASGQWYDETEAFGSKTLLAGGATVQLAVGNGFSIVPRVAYTTGSITRIEAGLGFVIEQ